MNQNATASLDGSINETIALRKMFEQVLVLDIVDFDGHMREAIEQTLLHRQLQDGKNMCDARFSQGLFATKGEQSIATIRFDISLGWWRLDMVFFLAGRECFFSSDVPADVNVQLARDLVEERHDEECSGFLVLVICDATTCTCYYFVCISPPCSFRLESCLKFIKAERSGCCRLAFASQFDQRYFPAFFSPGRTW